MYYPTHGERCSDFNLLNVVASSTGCWDVTCALVSNRFFGTRSAGNRPFVQSPPTLLIGTGRGEDCRLQQIERRKSECLRRVKREISINSNSQFYDSVRDFYSFVRRLIIIFQSFKTFMFFFRYVQMAFCRKLLCLNDTELLQRSN